MCIRDRDKRARYDQFGHAGMSGAAGGGFEGFGQGMSMDDIFSMFGDIFGGHGGGFGGFGGFGGGGRSAQRKFRGSDPVSYTHLLRLQLQCVRQMK